MNGLIQENFAFIGFDDIAASCNNIIQRYKVVQGTQGNTFASLLKDMMTLGKMEGRRRKGRQRMA